MNVIDITLSCAEYDSEVNVYHNHQLARTITANQGTVRIEVDTLDSSNLLTLSHSSEYNVVIDKLAMFDQGHEKLCYLGVFTGSDGHSWNSHVIEPEGQWSLSYQYPVFSWLHRTLNLGWLIKPDAT